MRQTFDPSRDMDAAQRHREECMVLSCRQKQQIAESRALEDEIDRCFAEMFDGDEDVAALRVAQRLGVSVARVEAGSAYEDASLGMDVDELEKMYL